MVYQGPAANKLGANTAQAGIASKYAWIALGVLAAASLLAQYGGPGETRLQPALKLPMRQAAALDSLRAFLNLSDEQVQQLQCLSAQDRESMKAISERARSNEAALHQLLSSNSEPDAAKAGQLVRESQDLRAQLQGARQELAAKASAVLTPRQQQKLDTLSFAVETEREASPGLMPESWPMLRAAAQLGIVAPSAQREGRARAFVPERE